MGLCMTIIDPPVIHDTTVLSTSVLIEQHISHMLEVIRVGKELRSTYSKDQAKILEENHANPRIDDLNLAFAVSKMSINSVDQWERDLNIMGGVVEDKLTDLIDSQDIKIMNLFVMALASLKPRSRRHLLNFLEAITDNEWCDGFFLAKGNDSEFRFVDKASELARAEFGLGQEKLKT